MGSLHTPLTEQYVLACLLEKPELLHNLKDNFFLNQESQTIYNSMKEMNSNKIPFTKGNLILQCSKSSNSITPDLLEAIAEIDYHIESLPSYIEKLKKNFYRHKVKHEVIENLILKVDKENSFDHSEVEALFKTGRTYLNEIKDEGRFALEHPYESTKHLENHLKNKSEGKIISTGYNQLDKLLGGGLKGGEITTIVGQTSMGKSIFSQSMFNRIMNTRTSPIIYANLEMSHVSSLQRIISMREGLPNEFWDLSQAEDKDMQFEIQQKVINKFKKDMLQYDKVRWTDNPSLGIDDLREMVHDFRDDLYSRGYEHETLIMFVDLLLMLKDFKAGGGNISTPMAIEYGMDALHRFVKEEDIALVALVQANRATEGDKKLSKVEKIREMKPELKHIKNSASIAERSRNILTLFRGRYYIDRYFPEQKELYDDLFEVSILKSSDASPGSRLYLMGDMSKFKLYNYDPIDPEDDINMDLY